VKTSPAISVTKICPVLPIQRGDLYTYTGVVSNTGNITLVNVYVVDNQPTNDTPVIGPITLAPGASVDFSGSYIVPPCDRDNCCFLIDTLTALGWDKCDSTKVTATATAVCPLLTLPGIALVQTCPPSPLPMGSVFNYSGFVTNTGNIVLTNVFVFGPEGTSTVLLGPIELAPMEVEFYSGSYTVPFDVCSVSVTARGQDTCGGAPTTNLVSCPVATTPALDITQNCPVLPVVQGGLLTYSGTVINSGNITLNNIVVTNTLSGNSPLITIAALAPGASANYTGSYLAPLTDLSTTSTSTARGLSLCGAPIANTVTSTCVIVSLPGSAGLNLAAPSMSNGLFSLAAFATVPGTSYTLQYKDDLLNPTWIDLETVVGTGQDMVFTNMGAPLPVMRFYRVLTITP
jgi:uncharacterized repeat protein (TIGR01451 family)